MTFILSFELMDAAKESGEAICRKEKTYRMTKANKVFVHFR